MGMHRSMAERPGAADVGARADTRGAATGRGGGLVLGYGDWSDAVLDVPAGPVAVVMHTKYM